MAHAGRSTHGVPRHARRQADDPLLIVDGSVTKTLELSPADLSALPHRRFLDAFDAAEIVNWPATDWSGIPLSAIVEQAAPMPEARWIRIGAGPYATVIRLEEARDALLCDALDGRPIPAERGGPWRLAYPRDRYFTGVKWIDRITVAIEEPDNSSLRIATARRRAREAKQG